MISLHRSMHSSQMKTEGPGDQLLDLVLALAAERAVRVFRWLKLFLGHGSVPVDGSWADDNRKNGALKENAARASRKPASAGPAIVRRLAITWSTMP